MLGGFVELGAKTAGRRKFSLDAALTRALKDAGVWNIAQDERHFGRDLAGRAGVGNGGEVRAAARTQHAQTEWLFTSHARSCTERPAAFTSTKRMKEGPLVKPPGEAIVLGMKRMQQLLFFFTPWMFAAAAIAQGKFIQIGYTNCLEVAKLPKAEFDKIGQLKWYFAHASVGANIMDGIADLHELDPALYQLRGVKSGETPPAATEAGVIYEHNRGNPGWKAKFDKFHACVSGGWRAPRVNIVVNKLCYIDQTASVNYYINSMTNLEAACPSTTLVYTTIPLMTDPDMLNYLRNGFNRRLRDWCRANGKVLLDIADIEAHDPKGAPCTFNYHGKACQKLCADYTKDGGHLNEQGRQLVARGFYALAAALVNRGAETSAPQTANAATK
jgi:hypothetical protein